MNSEFEHINLDKLGNPKYFQEPLSIENKDNAKELIEQLYSMILIRKAEDKLAEKIEDGTIKCPCHLGIGQEAIAVGVATIVRPTDKVFGAHRSHSHFLALNRDLFGLFAEVLGKEAGSSKGMGGSMHLIDRSVGFEGSVPIVSATIPIATGAALAAKFDGNKDLAVSFFGDGATEEGGFHESLNLSSTHNLPVLYVCENNLFSSHLHISLRQPTNTLSRYANAHLIKNSVVDGNDIISMSKVCQEAQDYIRETNQPYFIEAITYRWKGHVGHRDDMDVGVKRKDDLNLWKKRDPIRRLEEALIQNKMCTISTIEQIYSTIDEKVASAWLAAEKAEFPDENKLLELVHSK